MAFAHSDQAVQRYTHDEVRFADSRAVLTWADDRFLVILVPKNDPEKVAALIWFSQKTASFAVSRFNTTMGVRVYPPYRGKGLALDFCQQAFQQALQKKFLTSDQAIWLRVHGENEAAIVLYKKLGFQELLREGSQVFMILPAVKE